MFEEADFDGVTCHMLKKKPDDSEGGEMNKDREEALKIRNWITNGVIDAVKRGNKRLI